VAVQGAICAACATHKEKLMLHKTFIGLAIAAALAPVAAHAQSALASEGPWLVRVRATYMLNDNGNSPSLALGQVEVQDRWIPEFDVSYFFTDNIAAELILGTTRSTITGGGSLAGLPVGKTWILPPTLTLQYHFTNFGAFKPYVGAGVNYTMFYSQKAAGGVVTDLDVKDAFGVALQVGADYMFDDHWGLNVDVKKIFLDPDFKLNGGALSGKAELDPWLIGAGVTYRF